MHRIHDAFEERETPSQQGRRYSFDPAERAAAPADDPPRAEVDRGPEEKTHETPETKFIKSCRPISEDFSG